VLGQHWPTGAYGTPDRNSLSHIGWAAFFYFFFSPGVGLQLATLQLLAIPVLANRLEPARPAIGASGFHGLTQPNQSEAFHGIDPAKPPSHEHDMCQPAGAESQPSQTWLEFCKLGEASRPSSLSRGDPTAINRRGAIRRRPCCLSQVSIPAQQCCIRSALRLRKRHAPCSMLHAMPAEYPQHQQRASEKLFDLQRQLS
jgi:hypothetical protein